MVRRDNERSAASQMRLRLELARPDKIRECCEYAVGITRWRMKPAIELRQGGGIDGRRANLAHVLQPRSFPRGVSTTLNQTGYAPVLPPGLHMWPRRIVIH